MRKLCAGAIVVSLFAVVAGVLWPERAASTSTARCSESDRNFGVRAPKFIAWGRSGVVQVTTGFGPDIVLDTQVSIDGASFQAFSDLGGLRGIPVTMPRPQTAIHVVFRWQQETLTTDPVAKTCDLTIAGGVGQVGPMRFHEREGGVAVFETVEDVISKECARAALLPATLMVSSGSLRKRLTVDDQCYPNRVQRSAQASNWRLFTNVDGIAFRASGRKPARQTFSFTLRIGAEVTNGKFIVTRRFYHDSRIWQGTDNFVNICINRGYPIYSAGGRLYCVSPALLTFRVQRTK